MFSIKILPSIIGVAYMCNIIFGIHSSLTIEEDANMPTYKLF
jgi:hypothetical protein